MQNFNNNRSGRSQSGQRSDRRGSSKPRFGSRNSGRNQLHDAVCAECGNNCKIPFIPRSDKPVYCSGCFEQKGGGNKNAQRPNFANRNEYKPRNNRIQANYKEDFEVVNAKLDKILKILSVNENKKIVKKDKTNKISEETPVTLKETKKKRSTKKVKTVAEIIAQAEAE